jgi:hypothetical protein
VGMWCSFSRSCWCGGKYGDQGAPDIPSQVTRYSGYPSAALASSTFAGPRSTYAAPTAMTAPVTAAMAGSGLGFADVDELDVIGVKPPAARSATAIPACSRPMAA